MSEGVRARLEADAAARWPEAGLRSLRIDGLSAPGGGSGRRAGRGWLEREAAPALPVWIKAVNHPDDRLPVRLEQLWRRAQEGGEPDLLPRVWAYDREEGLLMTDYVGGHALRGRFFMACLLRRGRAARGLTRRCAIWLARYHRIAAEEPQLLGRGVPRLARALAQDRAWDPADRHRLGAALEWVQGSDLVTPVARLHNDYTLRNLVQSGGRIVALDWDALVHPEFPAVGDVWHDVAAFVINAESLARFWPLSSRRLLVGLAEDFLDRYCQLAQVERRVGRVGLWLARMRLDLGLVERPLAWIYRGPGAARFLHKHRQLLATEAAQLQMSPTRAR